MQKNKVLLFFFGLLLTGLLVVLCLIYRTGISLGTKPTPTLSIHSNLLNEDLFDCLAKQPNLLFEKFDHLKSRSQNTKDTLLYINIEKDKKVAELRLYKGMYTSVEKVWIHYNGEYHLYYITELNSDDLKNMGIYFEKMFSACQ